MPVVPQVALCALLIALLERTGSPIPVSGCPPSEYICEGRCPPVPPGVELPPLEEEDRGGGGGLCFKDTETEACVCWLGHADQHLQTLFKCEAPANGTLKHVMCLPPPTCFPPGQGVGCMIVLRCPCTDHGRGVRLGRWRSGVAVILRSKTPVPTNTPAQEEDSPPEMPPGDTREFSVKHFLFLLAFVIAPLLCWCLLTFFHQGKCRRKRPGPEAEPMPTERRADETDEPCLPSGPCAPTAPKMESPPPYREAAQPGESCLLAAECGPPPSYEDAVRDQRYQIQELDSE